VFAFPNGSPIRWKVNQAILAHIVTDAWQETLRRYLGADPQPPIIYGDEGLRSGLDPVWASRMSCSGAAAGRSCF
jgi:hypothetical protein